MKLRRLFGREQQRVRQGFDLSAVFRTVYGRDPFVDEEASLAALRCDPENVADSFRRVIGHFDHQFRHTPFSVRFTRADVSFLNVREGFTLALDSADASVSAQLLSGGEYEPHLVSFFKERIEQAMVFVDVGANIGFHTMLAARLVGDEGKVICFEPNSENCRLILLSLNENRFTNVSLYPVAASAQKGYAMFTTHVGSNGGLLPSTEEALLDANCVVVPTFRLDDLIKEKPDFIKIDTEGAEGLVLGGAKSLIERHRPVVVSEFSMEMLPRVSRVSGSEYLTYFKALGYDLHVIDRRGGGLVLIPDVALFLENYGEATRIEDLAFIPEEVV